MRTHRTVLVAAIAFATLGAQDAPAQDTESPRVAVMDFTGFMLGESGNSVNIGKAVSAMLTTEFTVRDGLEVLERQDISSLLQEQRLGLSGRVDESSAVAIGKILGVQYVFHGAVVSIANSLRVDIRAIDVETSEVKSVMKMTDMTTNLLVVIVNIADAFGDDLDLPPASERADIQPIPIGATIAFSRGVDYEDKGEIDNAIEQYEAALEAHPNHRDAQRALDRLREGGA
ncbi:MAG: CsgG/HfaB family protein [Gemmatimonadota bacterium]|nr:CsgG/HfaB family protein [Gemmatimonadota bacterium]